MRNKFYKDFTPEEISFGVISMKKELEFAPGWIKHLFEESWESFKEGNFSYDGATFVSERYENTLFEVAAFIHDRLNHQGFVGKNVDSLFLDIMKELQYKRTKIFIRKIWMNLTFLNVLVHILDKNKKYLGDIDYKSKKE